MEMTRRSGVSLVELILTLSACTVILTMSAGLIHRALHAQSKARRCFDVERSALRLGASFRRDVHAAQSVLAGDEAGGDGVLLRLELAGGQAIEYRQSADGIERLWFVDGAIRAREPFLFPAGPRFQAARESPQLVVLTALPPADATESESRPLPSYTVPVILRVAAIVGRDAHLVDAEEAQP
jgi:hypothetical protein